LHQHYEVQGEVGHGSSGRKTNGLREPFQENSAKHSEDHERHEDLALAQHRMQERILNGMLGGVGDSVMVITKSVAAKPSKTRTSAFPFHPPRRFSGIAMEPCPAKLRPATCA